MWVALKGLSEVEPALTRAHAHTHIYTYTHTQFVKEAWQVSTTDLGTLDKNKRT